MALTCSNMVRPEHMREICSWQAGTTDQIAPQQVTNQVNYHKCELSYKAAAGKPGVTIMRQGGLHRSLTQ